MQSFECGVYLIYKEDKLNRTLRKTFGDDPNQLGIIYINQTSKSRHILICPILSISTKYGDFSLKDYVLDVRLGNIKKMTFYKIKAVHMDAYNNTVNTNLHEFIPVDVKSTDLFLTLCGRRYVGYDSINNLMNKLPTDPFEESIVFNFNTEHAPDKYFKISKNLGELIEKIFTSEEYLEKILFYFNKDYNRNDQVILLSSLKSFVDASRGLYQVLSFGLLEGNIDKDKAIATLKDYVIKDEELEHVYEDLLKKLEMSTDELLVYPKLRTGSMSREDVKHKIICMLDKSVIKDHVTGINEITKDLISKISSGDDVILKYGQLLSKVTYLASLFGETIIEPSGVSSISGCISFNDGMESVPVLFRSGDRLMLPLNNPDDKLGTCTKDQLEEILIVLDIISNGDIKYDELRSKVTTVIAKLDSR